MNSDPQADVPVAVQEEHVLMLSPKEKVIRDGKAPLAPDLGDQRLQRFHI
jgi:hypothetical protein